MNKKMVETLRQAAKEVGAAVSVTIWRSHEFDRQITLRVFSEGPEEYVVNSSEGEVCTFRFFDAALDVARHNVRRHRQVRSRVPEWTHPDFR